MVLQKVLLYSGMSGFCLNSVIPYEHSVLVQFDMDSEMRKCIANAQRPVGHTGGNGLDA